MSTASHEMNVYPPGAHEIASITLQAELPMIHHIMLSVCQHNGWQLEIPDLDGELSPDSLLPDGEDLWRVRCGTEKQFAADRTGILEVKPLAPEVKMRAEEDFSDEEQAMIKKWRRTLDKFRNEL